MPNCFQLYRKGEAEPSILQDIDNELWLKFGGAIPEPNDHWFMGWHDSIGLMLACGNSFEKIKATLSKEIRPIVEYLENNYTPAAWYEHK
jgi:hypothetical protein